jgi:hypothetical protein
MRRRRRTHLAIVLALAGGCGRGPFPATIEELGGLDPEPDDPIVDGCDAVDYLFVIDDSASMGDNQSKLVDNYDTFIEGVSRSQDIEGGLHLGVVTTDPYRHNPERCQILGGLVTHTAGYASSNAQCGPFAEGHNFITSADDIDTAFSCAAQVGVNGSDTERPLSAAAAAVGPFLNAPDACNAGFVRDDALLVVVIVTDEDESSVTEETYETLVEAKNGFSDNVVVVSLVNEPDGPCRTNGHATPADDVVDFTLMFEHGFVAPICVDDYGPVFEQAVEVVEHACGR